MLLAEDILLLITATKKKGMPYIDLLTAGGLLTDLALAGNVRVTESGESTRRNRVVAVPDAPWPADPLLAQAAAVLGAKPTWWSSSVVEKLAKGLLHQVYDRLVRAELVSGAEHRVLGLFPYKQWTVIDRRRVDEIETRLDEVFLLGAEPDLHTAAIAALLSAGRMLVPVLDRGRKVDKQQVKHRGKAFQEQYWTAKALAAAVQGRDGAAAAAAG